MTSTPYGDREWKVGFRRNEGAWTAPLIAVWEVEFESIGDDYTVDEISAADLFRKWAKKAQDRFPDKMIPIHWYIDGKDAAKFEAAPFQYGRAASDEDFLSFYHWPVDAETGERLDWLCNPLTIRTIWE